MSLLAMIADNFELEQPPIEDDDDHECHLLTDLNSSASASSVEDEQGTDDSDSNEYVEYHDVLRQLRNKDSEGTAETEQSLDSDAVNGGDEDVSSSSSRPSKEYKLIVSFLLMVVVGTGMKIFQKLQAIPMYNYPSSLNLIQNFVYVPLCFMYIIPVSRLGLFNNSIPNEVTTMSKRPFVIMGLFDCVTCMLLTFSAVYLPGPLLILLPQAAIPISMFFSNRIKGDTYARYQYFGAVVVILGILVVLEPLVTQRHTDEFTCVAYSDEFCAACGEETTKEGCLSYGEGPSMAELDWSWKNDLHAYVAESSKSSSSGADTADEQDGKLCQWVSSASSDGSSSSSDSTSTILIWSIVTIFACIPMTLSSIYKEMALSGSETQIDPIFLNGWVAWYQFLFSFPLTVPAGMATGVLPSELPANIWDGIKCYLGISTITGGCHPDDLCSESPLYVNIFLLFNVAFNILLVYVLKFGSANVLFMAATVMVPIGNLAFALPFVPGSVPLHDSDIAGLLVILLGLITYRFGSSIKCRRRSKRRSLDDTSTTTDDGNLFSPGSVLPFSPDGVRRYARTLLNGGDSAYEDFYLDSPYEEEVESDFKGLRMPRSLVSDLEEPLLTPVESVY